MWNFIKRHKTILGLLSLGITIRLFFIFFITHTFDLTNIIIMSKSVMDTGNLHPGFFTIAKTNLEIQLYGKVYYQVIALWMYIVQTGRALVTGHALGVKPFSETDLYMIGAVKFVQLVYDFLLVFFMYKIGTVLKIQNKILLIFYWAINFYLMFTSYAQLQSDLAMVTCLSGGVFFALKAISENHSRRSEYTLKTASLFFFALGAIIKQVPLLVVPFALFIFSSSVLSFFGYSILFAFFYLLLSQPWSIDSVLVRSFFMNSRESLALFNFQLNSIPVFLFLYGILFLTFFRKKNEFLSKPINLIYLVTTILTIVYISEDSSFFFPQFTVWIMPFLLIISLVKKEYGIYLIVPVIAFLKRVMIDGDFLAGALRQIFGIHPIVRYSNMLRYSLNPTVIDFFLNTVIAILFILLIVNLMFEMKIIPYFKLDFPEWNDFIAKYSTRIVTAILLSYILFMAVDVFIKSRYVNIRTEQINEESSKVKILENKLTLNMDNPYRKKITGLIIKASRDRVLDFDSLVIRFIDRDTKKIISEQKIFDYNITPDEDDNYFFLKKSVDAKHMTLQIFKETKSNMIFFRSATVSNRTYSKEEAPIIHLLSKGNTINMKLMGQYTFKDALDTFSHIVAMKPKFFVAYAILLIVSTGITILLLKGSQFTL